MGEDMEFEICPILGDAGDMTVMMVVWWSPNYLSKIQCLGGHS